MCVRRYRAVLAELNVYARVQVESFFSLFHKDMLSVRDAQHLVAESLEKRL